MTATTDEALAELLRYADQMGLVMTGITPRRLPGRGYGVVATRDIEKGETVLEVPTQALRTVDTVPEELTRHMDKNVSVHGMLAMHLMQDEETGEYAAWDAVLPTPDDVAAGMPLLWPAELQELLPTPASNALMRQRIKLEKDWACVRPCIGARDRAASSGSRTDRAARRDSKTAEGRQRDRERIREIKAKYTHAWLLVNSRTFYYTTPRSAAAHPQADDRLAMQPVADLFNHTADGGCSAAYDAKGFTFVADRAYAAGDEVPISYGTHADDALLVEYGFVLAPPAKRNRWDEVCLDAAVLARLSGPAREDLEAAGFLGRYMIDADTPGGCYRTQVALRRILCGSSSWLVSTAWMRFLDAVVDVEEPGGRGSASGNGRAAAAAAAENRTNADDSALSQSRVDRLLLECLADMADRARAAVAAIEGRLTKADIGSEHQRALLAQRWRHIETCVELAAAKVSGEE